MHEEKAIILCSGGLNSAVAAAVARREYAPALLHVRFAHRAAEREAEQFEKQAEHFGAKLKLVVDMPHFGQIGGNARVDRKMQLEDATVVGDAQCPSHVPGLIMTLLGAACTWTRAINAKKVFLGVSENLGPPAPATGGVYPDYSREHIELCRQAMEIASPGLVLETPIMELSRTEIVKLGHRLKAPLEHTWSCLASGIEPCGRCMSCATRNRGFLDAALPDPILCQPAAV
jgi:7-cyano-7-deazaguanine synthase